MPDVDSNIFVSPEVREVLRLHRDLFADGFRTWAIRDQLERQAQRIVEAHAAGDEAAGVHLACWHPLLVGSSAAEIMRHELTVEDCRLAIAREYGFDDWAHVDRVGTSSPDPTFESALDALLGGDVPALRALLGRHPSLVRERSSYGHRATLLHYVGSNGVETHRQVVPLNLAEMARLVLDAGADPNAPAGMYGGGSTTLMLLTTSAHPAAAGVTEDVVRVLREAGAR